MSVIDVSGFETVLDCRSCGGTLLPVLSLGDTPLANSLLTRPDESKSRQRYPLDLMRCAKCSLVQLAQIVAPHILYSVYPYFSSYSSTMLQHAQSFVTELVELEGLGSESFVVEVASNDGYLLQFLQQRGIPVLGIEPAANIARLARDEKAIPTLVEFFSSALAVRLASQGRRPDVIIGNNVLAHIPALNDFVAGVATLLASDGTAVFEVPYLRDLVEQVEFDTIYHEHQCYYTLTALTYLFRPHGLEIWHVQRLSIHGGSIRIWAARTGTRTPTASVGNLLAAEDRWGVAQEQTFAKFALAVAGLKSTLVTLCDGLKYRGKRIAAYGAAAKGVTLTSYCGIGAQYLDFIVDNSPHKQGLRFPVDDLLIEPTTSLIERRPDYTLLLTWNFATEILNQQAAYRAVGGRFIVPVPLPRIIP